MSDVEMRFNVTGNAVTEIDKLTGQVRKISSVSATAKDVLGGMGISLEGLGNPAQLAGKALRAVYDTVKESIDKYADYGKQVGDVSRQLGITAKEASELIQVADDLEIEFGTLRLAMKQAQKDGIDPSIEGIKKLAKEYQAIESPTERARYAMEKFGRAGIEMQKLLELAPAQLDEMAASAGRLGLVLDEKGVQAAKEYRMAVDNLEDAWAGFQMRIGTGVVPVINDLLGAINEGIDTGYQRDEILKLADAYGFLGDMTAEAVAKRNTLTGGQFLNDLTQQVNDYTSALRETDRIEEIRLRRFDKTVSGIEDVTEATAEARDVTAQYSKALLFNAAAAEMDKDAAIAFGIALGVIDTRVMVIDSALVALKEKYDINKDGLIDVTEAANGYTAALLGINAALEQMPAQMPASGGGVSSPTGSGGTTNRYNTVNLAFYGANVDEGTIAATIGREVQRR